MVERSTQKKAGLNPPSTNMKKLFAHQTNIRNVFKAALGKLLWDEVEHITTHIPKSIELAAAQNWIKPKKRGLNCTHQLEQEPPSPVVPSADSRYTHRDWTCLAVLWSETAHCEPPGWTGLLPPILVMKTRVVSSLKMNRAVAGHAGNENKGS